MKIKLPIATHMPANLRYINDQLAQLLFQDNYGLGKLVLSTLHSIPPLRFRPTSLYHCWNWFLVYTELTDNTT